MNRFSLFRYLALTFFFHSSISIYAQATPPEHVEAYVMIVKAEQAEQVGDPASAFQYYGKALELYRIVASDYPEWQPAVVRSRVTACRNHLDRLRKLLLTDTQSEVAPADNGAMLSAELIVAERAAWNEEKAVFEQAIEDLEEERVSLIESNRMLHAGIADLEGKIRNIERREKVRDQQSADRVKKATESLESLQRELDALKSDRAKLQEQLLDKAALEPILAEVGRVNKLLEEERLAMFAGMEAMSNQIALLNRQLEDERKEVISATGAMNGELERLREETRALKQTIDSHQADMRRIREFRKTISSLEKENKSLTSRYNDVQKQMEKILRDDEKKRLQAQNSVLVEELQVFRSRLEASERRVRELERRVAPATDGN
ncbi:MAG TPA: hypothetical protein PJ991_04865 [Kiritimatiellia bacterium]|nr:hypothetical protein [Kiritimatiellia bacterium]